MSLEIKKTNYIFIKKTLLNFRFSEETFLNLLLVLTLLSKQQNKWDIFFFKFCGLLRISLNFTSLAQTYVPLNKLLQFHVCLKKFNQFQLTKFDISCTYLTVIKCHRQNRHGQLCKKSFFVKVDLKLWVNLFLKYFIFLILPKKYQKFSTERI